MMIIIIKHKDPFLTNTIYTVLQGIIDTADERGEQQHRAGRVSKRLTFMQTADGSRVRVTPQISRAKSTRYFTIGHNG